MEPNQEAAATAVLVHDSAIPSGDNGWFNPIEFPIGYRFLPSDEELITDYLVKKVLDQNLPADIVKEVDLYKYSPQELDQLYGARREKEMYFFTRTKPKYANGSRPNREAPGGTWRASTSKIPITGGNGRKIGDKMMLVYHKTEKKQKTDWLMHEYTISSNSKKTEGYVLCKVYNKSSKQVLKISTQQEEPRQNKELHPQPNHAANLFQENQEPQISETYPDYLPQQNLGYENNQPLQGSQNLQLQGFQNNQPLEGYQYLDSQSANELFTIDEYAQMGIDVTPLEYVPDQQNQNQNQEQRLSLAANTNVRAEEDVEQEDFQQQQWSGDVPEKAMREIVA
ncbi:hypothetical protein TIFTF001_043139 [Ficus carica]|uniref:NAC domain-containing protein n=1 Tax=Ficus carica TaxID=3494 RepID=A0AA88CL11_FICCA|nr:hypothetical protein TIFTF001_043136 [Ficus carica]GMN20666.1 hypothetical protein TIFTF001_043139 [Ficus carica]